MSRTTHRAIRRAAAIRCERTYAKRAAHIDLLVEMIVEGIHVGPDRASVERAQWAVDRLRSMLPTSSSTAGTNLPEQLVEQLARTAGLPEVAALDLRRENGQAMTVPERRAWRRLKLFADLLAIAIVSSDFDHPSSNSTPGAGPVAAP